MSNDPNLRLLIQEANDAARDAIKHIEKRQKEMDRIAIAVGLGAVALLVISYCLETSM